MSKPMRDTIYGTVSFENDEFGVLEHFHLDETRWKKIKKLGKPEIYSPFSSWNNYQPQWCIEGGKLYLTDISITGVKDTMKEIFGTNKLFAKWVNEAMKLLVKKSKQKPIVVNSGEMAEKTVYEITMDTLILDFEDGILKGSESKQESYRTGLKNYLEELG